MSSLGQANIKVSRPGFKLAVDFAIPQHGVLGLFGPSGCGKTTILRVLAGLEQQTPSVITIGDKTWQDGGQINLPPEQRNIGYVFQDSLLFPHMTVAKNLNYALKRMVNNRQIETPMNQDEVTELLGIEHLLEKNPNQLSGGEQQRVAIARALLRNPDLLLLDEPLASLDQQRKSDVLPFLQRLHRELSIPMLYVSHSLEEVMMICDAVITLNDGQATYQGSVVEAMTSPQSPLSADSHAATVLECQVSNNGNHHGLTQVRTAQDNVLWIKRFQSDSQKVRVVVPADEVSLCLQPPTHSTILNALAGEVVAIQALNQHDQMVSVAVNSEIFLSRISTKSLVELGIHTGQPLWLQFKAQSARNCA